MRNLIIRVISSFLVSITVFLSFSVVPTSIHAAVFTIGDTVEVTQNLNVRTNPGVGNPEISDSDYYDYAPTGTRGQIIGGPSNADTYVWWQVDFGPGLYSGWCVEGGLVKVAAVISASIIGYTPSSAVSVSPGSSTTISVTFTNTGNTAWTFIAGATVWDSTSSIVANYSSTLSSSLQPNQQTTTSWNHPVNQAGDYWIQFGIWKASPFTAENLLVKSPSPSQLLIHGVQQNQPPTCSVSPTPSSGNAPLNVRFNLNASDDDAISNWLLDVNSDSIPDYSGTGQPPAYQDHTYTTPGNYTIVFMVSDTDQVQSTSFTEVNVGSTNTPPTCSLAANTNLGNAPLEVTFTIAASDSDGVIESWAFDADGNGAIDYSDSGNPPSTITHVFPNEGSYIAMLMVSDDADATAVATQTIQVSASAKPDLVVTNIQVTPNPPVAGRATDIIVTTTNQGGSDITSTFLLSLYIDNQYQGQVQINGLSVGAVHQSPWQSMTWPDDSLAHTIRAVVDSSYVINESSESNNERIQEFAASSGQAELTCSPLSFSFTANKGGTNPTSQTLYIQNIGDDSLNWSVSDGAAWLSLTPANGTSTGELDSVMVSINVSGMDSGTFTAVITITASGALNSPRSIPVTLTITNPNAITFPDPNLEAIIRDTLGKPIGDITPADMATISILNANSKVITHLGGLEYCTGLRELNLSYNSITDISPLTGCQQLYLLNLSHNNITSISILSQIQTLKLLYLSNNLITDITSLRYLQYLQRVVLFNNQISNIYPLVQNSGITSGEEVDVRTNPLSETSINTYIPQLQARGVNVLFDNYISIMIDTSSLTFIATQDDDNPPNQTFNIWRVGNASALDWTVSTNVNWISLTPASGSSTGEYDTVTVSINTSGLTAGEYQSNIIVMVTGATNSPQTIPVTLIIEGSSQPDLVIESITWSPQNPSIGDTVTLTVKIKNQGKASANSSYVYYFIDGTQVTTDSVSSISSGMSTTETFTWQVQAGEHTITAIADYKGQISESNELNNEKQVTFSPSLADLVVQAVTWSPVHPSVGETVTFTVTIKNQGTGDANSSKIYYYIDSVKVDSDSVSSLNAGGTTTETFTWSAKEGTHTIKATIDPTNAITESNETNNDKTITYSATTLPDLIVQSVSFTPEIPEDGDTVTFTVVIKNHGEGDADSSKIYYYIDEVQQAYDSVTSLNSGSTTTESFSWTCKDGSHEIKIIIDRDNLISESDETNNEKTINIVIGEEIDNIAPIVTEFTVSSESIDLGDSVTISFRVNDSGGSGLNRVELWRSEDINGSPNRWVEIGRQIANGYDYSGYFHDTPDFPGIYWYGVHVVDNNENWGAENTPKKVIINPKNGVNPDYGQVSNVISEKASKYDVPVIIIKAMAWQESEWKQFNKSGQPLTGKNGDVGIMQITPSTIDDFNKRYHLDIDKELVKTDFEYNIEVGTKLINLMYDELPEIGDANRSILENWYFAIWRYNGVINPPYYPDSVLTYIKNPPIPYWQSVTVSRPDDADLTLPLKSIQTPLPMHSSDGTVISQTSYTEIEIEKLRKNINYFLLHRVTYPTYISSIFIPPDLADAYDDLYKAGIDYDSLSIRLLIEARDFLNNSNYEMANKYYNQSNKVTMMSFTCFSSANDVLDGSLEALEKAVSIIHELCEWTTVIGFTIINPEMGKAAGFLWSLSDIAIDYSTDGVDGATQTLIHKVVMEILLNQIPFSELGGKTIQEYTTNKIGKLTFPMIEKLFSSNEARQFFASKLVKALGDKITGYIIDQVIENVLDLLSNAIQYQATKVESPVELRLYDSEGHITGLVDGEIKQEIPGTFYDDETITQFFPEGDYHYEIIGTEDGLYGLQITSVQDDGEKTLHLTEISTNLGSVHEYAVDWDIVAENGEGITMKVDADGDGSFENTINLSGIESSNRIPIWVWICIGVLAGLCCAFVIWRYHTSIQRFFNI